jgi:hypothetical protein
MLPAIKYLIAELPPPIVVNQKEDDANLKSLCIKKQEPKDTTTVPSSPRRNMLKNISDNSNVSGESHLWFYLQLEIECFNVSLIALRETLTFLLDHTTCPPNAMEMISALESNYVPSAWLKYSFDKERNKQLTLQLGFINCLSEGKC